MKWAALHRWPPMLVWLVAVGYTAFQERELGATTTLFALTSVAATYGIGALWGPRTRPRRSAFWFLIHILLMGALIALVAVRPLLGAVAAIPVALLWFHDSPASPTAMLVWGVALVLWQPDLWNGAEADIAWDIMLSVVLFIAAAQFERNRLAARHFTQAGFVFSILRVVAVMAISMLFIAGREGLRAVNAFTYLGIDASGVGGKMAMLAIVAASIAVAAALFRVRPDKAPALTVSTASAHRRAPDEPVDPKQEAIDFDAPSPGRGSGPARARSPPTTQPSRARTSAAKPAKGGRQPPRQPTRQPRPAAAAKPAKPARQPARPGELDFD